MPDRSDIVAQIDRALRYDDHRRRGQFDDLSDLGSDVHHEVKTVVSGTIERLAPPGSSLSNKPRGHSD